MRIQKFIGSSKGLIRIHGVLFVVILGWTSCQKEDIDELTIVNPDSHTTETVFPPDFCEDLMLYVGDACAIEVQNDLIEGVVSEACDCSTSPEPCGLQLEVTTSADNGTASGAVAGTAVGGSPPYTYAWFQAGQFIGSYAIIDGVPAGLYQLVVHDQAQCSMAAVAAVELDLSGWDCPEWIGDIGDECLTNEGEAGVISSACACILLQGCSISLTFLEATADDGTSSGSATIYISGGGGPYAWTAFTSEWETIGSGSIADSAALFSVEGLSSGYYAIEFLDAVGCVGQIIVSIP